MDDNPIRVLLVEDDEDDYFLARDLLSEVKNGGYSLERVATYDDGLEAMRQNRHDIYLLDYRLDRRTGVELLREAAAQGCRGPVILLTGQGERAVDLEAMKSGAADFLTKGRTAGWRTL
jgi:FixJ family two-component response regulator